MIHGDVEEIVGFGSVYLMCDVVCLDSEERISIDADKQLLSLPIKSYSESTTYNCRWYHHTAKTELSYIRNLYLCTSMCW
jgi:hypothetical protein